MRSISDALGRVSPMVGGAVLALAVLAGVLALVLSGGSDDKKIPASAAALVGDTPITNSALAHWEQVYTKTATASQQKPTAAQARRAAFDLLAGFTWIENEAARRNVKVTTAQVDTAVNQIFAQFKGATKQQVLDQLGSTEADVRRQQKVALLANALQSRVAKAVPAPSGAQIQATYQKEPQRWAHPSKRDARAVLTADQKSAAAAKAALAAGQDFTTVSKKYSADTSMTQAGGALKGIVPGTGEPAFERALFSAPLGQLEGPVKLSSGFVVFKVQKITPMPAQTLQQATKAIKQELTTLAQSKAVDKYLSDLRNYWKSRTKCVDSLKGDQYCKA